MLTLNGTIVARVPFNKEQPKSHAEGVWFLSYLRMSSSETILSSKLRMDRENITLLHYIHHNVKGVLVLND